MKQRKRPMRHVAVQPLRFQQKRYKPSWLKILEADDLPGAKTPARYQFLIIRYLFRQLIIELWSLLKSFLPV